MKTLIDIAVPAMTMILLAAVGLDLTVDDFARIRRQPALVVTGLVAPLVLLPPIAVALTRMFRTPPDVTAGVLLLSACPIGGISNTYSYLARASTALSVTLTGLSCLCAVVTIPLVGKALELSGVEPLSLAAPIPMLVAQLVLVFGLPVTLGVWARRRVPELAERHQPLLQRIAFIGIGVVILLVIADEPAAFVGEWITTVPLAALFVSISMAVGWITAIPVTPDPRDRFTIAAEFGTRNVGVATAIAVTLLGRVEFARFAAIYFLIEAPLILAAAAVFRRQRSSEAPSSI